MAKLTKNNQAVTNKPITGADDDFLPDTDLNNNDESKEEWQEEDLGDFEVVALKNEGDKWRGYIVGDCAVNRPDWLPEQFDADKLFETINIAGKKGVIAKWFRITQAVEKYGVGKKVKFQFTRLAKKGDKQTDFVDFAVATSRQV